MRYRQRMTDFIVRISESPVKKVHPYKHPSAEGRSMRTTFRTEKERIKANIQRNRIYETTPSPGVNKTLDIRRRRPEKELGGPKFRQKPSTTLERVMGKIQNFYEIHIFRSY